ncbi:hypothetical protein [uncultured Robinsoniella sp.]|uniref:hypothetical protein n=1 Tax=uncultured Robinsoniella sp. TaxID=904190 RepID=UPI00374EA097
MRIRSFFAIVLCFLCIMPLHVNAKQPNVIAGDIQYLSDGSYFETIITSSEIKVSSRAGTFTRSGSKTTNYKNSSGQIMWSVSVNGTYSYTVGKSSTCTSASASASSKSSSWKVSSPSSKRSGKSATATATGTLYMNGSVVNSYTQSVRLSCDSYGNLS